jgi:hypothetical protein
MAGFVSEWYARDSAAFVHSVSDLQQGYQMHNGPNENGFNNPVPPWGDCDFFCINDYAGTGASRCGWRGRLKEVRKEESSSRILCPRCGCATLFRIPRSLPE